MSTSAKNSSWPLDIEIKNLDDAGLPSSSIIRMKFFTLDHQLIIRKAGELCDKDKIAVDKALTQLLLNK